ncbi:hypothetical protein [Streptomyces sp. Je 1-369]|uniref:hypothetical protein n=1 Tax=Streptomyces sp. Je 1-369 TaxID=2966192 RepID=UPI0022854EDB|nr:hypothetical protein [Streptomyces sp. Je 1-369]WAL94005.1 hypothetical protein NOO62_05500 [Streptomyces sp. Je 1-369]
MAFPEDPLGLRVEIRTGTVWTDITADVKTADPITHARGIRNSGTAADPATCPLKIDNKDGRYSPRNPMSPYYGLIGRNTPMRMWLPGGPHFLDLDGSPTISASTPDAAVLDITGDLDIRIEAATSWYAPGPHTLIGKWDTAGNQRSYLLRLQDGQLYLSYSTDGTSAGSFFHSRSLPALPPRAALRATLDVDNGSGGRTARFYWAPSLVGPWAEFGAPVALAGPISIYSGTAPLTVAPSDLTTSVPRLPIEGRVYAAEVRSGIGGTVVAAPNFAAQGLGSTGLTDSAGRVWSYASTAIADRQERFVGEISTWPQRWVPSEKAVWTTVEASGILRRYGQGQKALDSTLRRRIPSGRPLAYWPMEEEREATRAYSPIKGVTPAAVTGLEFAGVDTLPSSKALPKLTAAATLSAIVPTYVDVGQWQVEFVYTADDKAPPAAEPWPEVISVSTTGTVRRWWVGMRTDSARLLGYDASGAELVHHSIGIGGDVFHGWVRMRLWARDLGGGTMEYQLAWQDVGGTAGVATNTTSALPGRVTAVTANWGPRTEGWAIGHLAVLPAADSSLYTGSDDGYAGETAWGRMLRLANEEQIPLARIAGPLTPERVGPQRPQTLLALLQEAAEADGGMLLESRERLGLLYRDRSSLYTQEPALVLDYADGTISTPLEPVDDDTATRNDITVTRTGGSSARAVLEEGPLSVQPPPDGIGLYDESVTLNLDDDVQPVFHSYWRLHLGTYDGARYPSARIRLHRRPTLIPAVLALREGDVIRLMNLPPWVAYGPVDLLVTGYSEVMLPRTWEITFTCEPGGPWDLAKVNVIHEGFEDDTYEVPITPGGTLPWTRTSAQARSGTNSLRSGAISNNQTSDAAITLPPGATSLSFWYRTSSETSGPGFEGDRLLVLVDGVQVLRAQGVTPWTKTTLDVIGKSVVLFRYAKDNSSTAGEDAVYVDDLRFVLGAYQPAKADTDGCQLLTAATATATTLDVVSALSWTTEPSEMPITLQLGGEEVNATAIAALAGVGEQRLTVVRSVNGVSKPHTIGTPVSLARPAIASL